MSRRVLQAVNVVLGLLTIALAAMTLVFGADSPVYASAEIPELPSLDSNLRFFGGLGLGLGLALLWIVPAIEKRTRLFRTVWGCAFLGGIGRLVSMVVVGPPPLPMIAFAAIEVPLIPVLLYWQYRVAGASAKAG